MNPKHILRWTAFAAIYFALQAIPTGLYGDNPALRGANAVAVAQAMALDDKDNTLAAVQAPIIMMSQNRMAARDRLQGHGGQGAGEQGCREGTPGAAVQGV